MLYERFLDRMQLSILSQPFDGQHLFSLDDTHGNNARADSPVAEHDGARSALAFSAAVFRSRKSKVGAQHPQKRSVRICGNADVFSVEFEGNALIHN